MDLVTGLCRVKSNDSLECFFVVLPFLFDLLVNFKSLLERTLQSLKNTHTHRFLEKTTCLSLYELL